MEKNWQMSIFRSTQSDKKGASIEAPGTLDTRRIIRRWQSAAKRLFFRLFAAAVQQPYIAQIVSCGRYIDDKSSFIAFLIYNGTPFALLVGTLDFLDAALFTGLFTGLILLNFFSKFFVPYRALDHHSSLVFLDVNKYSQLHI